MTSTLLSLTKTQFTKHVLNFLGVFLLVNFLSLPNVIADTIGIIESSEILVHIHRVQELCGHCRYPHLQTSNSNEITQNRTGLSYVQDTM